MKLKKQTIKELEQIMARDYGVALSEEKLTDLGTTLLKLTRLATASFARTDENKNSSIRAREVDSLGANTSKE